jgi:paraquat-inducible protein A
MTCRLCGCEHAVVALAPGQRATCTCCGATLARRSRFGLDAPLAFALTGLLLALPALTQPLLTVSKFGNTRAGLVVTGVAALWQHGMRLLAIWVLLCGTLAPVLLLGLLAALLLPQRLGLSSRAAPWLARAAHSLEYWAMPEVHVLAVLVALVKLGSIVGVALHVGFWCYAAMSVMTLLAWRSFDPEVARVAQAK